MNAPGSKPPAAAAWARARAWAVLLCAGVLAATAAHAASLDDTARWLAGLPGATPASDDAQVRAAQRETELAWDELRRTRLAPMAAFAQERFASLRADCDTLFYPFGGPDILNAVALFPHCRRYVLFGLEPVGALPEPGRLDTAHQAGVLADMHAAQQYIVRRNFFVTQYMTRQLNTPNLQGVLPLLVTTLARMDYALIDVQTANLDGSFPPDPGGRPRAVYLHFRPRAGGPVQELVFASFDASDEGLARRPGFLRYFAAIEPSVTLIKAASYLLAEPNFTRMRTLIESRSGLIVQDDSGLPYAELRAHGYAVELLGNYVGTIPQFRYRYQKDLAAAYAALPARTPLPFAWSYAWKPSEEALQVARPAPREP